MNACTYIANVLDSGDDTESMSVEYARAADGTVTLLWIGDHAIAGDFDTIGGTPAAMLAEFVADLHAGVNA